MPTLHGVDATFVREYLTLTIVLGLAVLQLLTYLRGRRTAVTVEGEVATRPAVTTRYVPENLCKSRQEAQEERIRRLELAEQGIRAELATIRSEMKADRTALQDLLRSEMAAIHRRVNEILVAVAELRGPGRNPPLRGDGLE